MADLALLVARWLLYRIAAVAVIVVLLVAAAAVLSLLGGCGAVEPDTGVEYPYRPTTEQVRTWRYYLRDTADGCLTVRAESGGYVISDYGYVTECNTGGDVGLYCPEGESCVYSMNRTCDCGDHRWERELLVRGVL